MKAMAAGNGFLKTKIATWAKSIGTQGTYDEIHEKDLPMSFKLAKTLVYNNIKKALGLD
jgi:long-chain-fatty-acid--CoA ligase ACSBG